MMMMVSVFLQEFALTLFDLHAQTVEHEHEMISSQAFGIG